MRPDRGKIYSNIALYLVLAQAVLPTLDLSEDASLIATSAVLALISIFSKLAQKANLKVDRKSQWLLNILIVAAAAGFFNDLFSVVHIEGKLMDGLRIFIAFIINYTNVIAKYLFPTDEAKSIARLEDELDNTQKVKNFLNN